MGLICAVRILRIEREVKFALVESYSGTIEARVHGDLERATVSRPNGRSTFGMAFGGRPAKITGLAPGTYTVCATPYPDEVGALEGEEYMLREGDTLPVFCTQLTLAAAPRERALEIRVKIPAYVPPPSGD